MNSEEALFRVERGQVDEAELAALATVLQIGRAHV